MQEEIEQKSFNIMISTTKLSARTVLRAVKAAFRLYQSKTSQGKQSVRTLLRQNRGVSSVEISKTGIRGLERYAKKYGIDYAIRKDTSEVPPRYLVFFKAPDADAGGRLPHQLFGWFRAAVHHAGIEIGCDILSGNRSEQ